MPTLSIRHLVLAAKALLGNVQWLVAWAIGWVGWGLYIWALGFAPLSIVQTFSAGGVGFLGLFVWRFGRTQIGVTERIGVVVSIAGLTCLSLSLSRQEEVTHFGLWRSLVWIGVCCVLAGFVAGPISKLVAAGAGLGAASGFLDAGADVATKCAWGGYRWLFIPLLLVLAGAALIALQGAFQRGSALATAGVSTLLTGVVPIAAGLFVFGDHIPAGVPGVLRVSGFVLSVAGGVTLARKEDAEGSTGAPS
jgi:hypothetical protein